LTDDFFKFFFYILENNIKYDYTLRKDKNQGMHLGVFMYFHDGFFFMTHRFMKDIMVFLIWKNIYLFEKIIGACREQANKQVSSAVFRWHLQCHLVVKPVHPPYTWVQCCVFFFMRWHVEVKNCRIVANDHLSRECVRLSSYL